MLLRDLFAGETEHRTLLSAAHEINPYACLNVITFRRVSFIEDVCELKSHVSGRFFLVLIVKLLYSHV